MKKIFNMLLLFVVSIQLAGCQQKKKEVMEQFEWEEWTSAPLGYPVEVYRGGLELADESYVSLFQSTITGRDGWGGLGSGMSSGIKPLPNRLNVTYLSYVENQFYHADCAIDYDKIVKLFNRPFQLRGASGNLRSKSYNRINVGFAPGGMLVVWVCGAGRSVEIGRYQAQKIVIPKQESDVLDAAEHLIFEETEVKRVMQSESIIPIEVQEANKNKSIPFGLWDSYRVRYNWIPIFQIQNEGTMGDFGFSYFNGESDGYFYEKNKQSENNGELFYQLTHDDVALPIPSTVAFDWQDKNNKRYAGYFQFNENEIFQAFEQIIAEDKDTKIEMLIRVNISNTYATVLLKGSNGKEVSLTKHDDKVFFAIKKS